MERIIYGNALAPTSIVEHVTFSAERPYTISIKSFLTEDITIPHYGDFFEIILCDRIHGTMIISPEQYSLDGSAAYIIPPKVVHSTYMQGEGKAYVIKLPLKCPGDFFSMENILLSCGRTTTIRTISIPDHPKLLSIVNKMISVDKDPVLRLSAVLEFLSCLVPCFQPLQAENFQKAYASDPLCRVIDWTEQNLSKAILVDGAAKVAGYSKHYFCRWFKASTTFTYGEYVQRIRVDHACRYLLMGHSVSETSHLCGYENTSYFIRIFSRYRHCTPKEYCQNYYALEKNLGKDNSIS